MTAIFYTILFTGVSELLPTVFITRYRFTCNII